MQIFHVFFRDSVVIRKVTHPPWKEVQAEFLDRGRERKKRRGAMRLVLDTSHGKNEYRGSMARSRRHHPEAEHHFHFRCVCPPPPGPPDPPLVLGETLDSENHLRGRAIISQGLYGTTCSSLQAITQLRASSPSEI